jgi:3-hydroxyisobutyrate dehydrogenase and related beta-hydroxyacid dehydrogenases
MTKILIVGYGTITKGLIKNYCEQSDIELYLFSRHFHANIKDVTVINDFNLLNKFDFKVILTCFRNDDFAKEFYKNLDGNSSFFKNKIIIDLSTSQVKEIVKRKKLVENQDGFFVESPFTGSREGSEQGKLSLFVHYPDFNDSLKKLVKYVLSIISSKTYVFEESGNPTKFKLLYNFWGASILLTLKYFNPRYLEFNEKDLVTANSIVKTDGWMSLVCSSKLDIINADSFDDIHFKAELMLKDLIYATEEIAHIHNSEYCSFVTSNYSKIKDKEKDYTVVSKLELEEI